MVRFLFTLQEFPSSFPPDQVVEIKRCTQCGDDNCTHYDHSEDIKDLLQHLPEWVEPHMVYPEDSVEKGKILGVDVKAMDKQKNRST